MEIVLRFFFYTTLEESEFSQIYCKTPVIDIYLMHSFICQKTYKIIYFYI